MLPKHSRLTKQIIENYLLKARRVTTSRFFVIYTKVSEDFGPQISFTCSKKVAGSAVVRNKLRRRGYTAVRPVLPLLAKGSILLIAYTKADLKTPLADIRSELAECFAKIKLL